MPPAVQRALVSDQVFRLLSEQILSGRYEPGEKLPTQRTLAADLGVNMASVREAVKRLEQLRLVEVRHGDAMRVRDWRSDGGLDVVAQLIFAAGGVDRPTLEAVLEARRLMLTESARLAAERRTDEQAQRLAELARQVADAPDVAAAQLLDLAFMAELVEASGNVVFVLVLNTVRRLYLDHAELLQAVVADRHQLAPLYARAAQGIADRAEAVAASAIADLAGEQERRILEGLG
jgi:GntR family transcriptional regulator, transcriptional repressor for pyruvate dehydrogenase complex